MNQNFKYMYKIIIIGDSGVGKSNIVSRFVDDTFTSVAKSTIGMDFETKTIELGEEIIKLQLWDTAGQERFRVLTRSYYRYAGGIILVFDITNRDSFNNLEKWIMDIEKSTNGITDLTNVEFLIIGNKSDLFYKRQVDQKDIDALHDKYSFTYIETSAKDNLGITEGLNELAKRIHKNRHYIYKDRSNEGIINLNVDTDLDQNVDQGCRCIIL